MRGRARAFLIYLVRPGEGVGDDALKFLPDVLTKEIAEVEYRCVVFLGEPRSALALFGSTKVATIAAWRFATYTIVLPKSVFEESLRQRNLEETAIGFDRQGKRRVKERTGVNDIEQGDAFLPNLYHRGIEGEDILLTSFLGGLFGDGHIGVV